MVCIRNARGFLESPEGRFCKWGADPQRIVHLVRYRVVSLLAFLGMSSTG